MREYISINPENNEVLKKFELHSQFQIENKIKKAQSAFQINKGLSFQERSIFFESLSSVLEKRKNEIAKTITLEMGKLLKDSIAEVNKCISTIDFYCGNGEGFLKDEAYVSSHSKTVGVYEPFGIIYGIMPWNFPLWQALRFAIPTILAGNVVLLKHAESVPQSAEIIESCFHEALFPEGLYQNIRIDYQQSNELIQHSYIRGVSLTGSERAGTEIASISGKAIKKTVLELGGSDAFIILNDADLENVIPMAITARFQNNGQTCIAGKRFIIESEIFEDFKKKFIEEVKDLKIGSPFDEGVQIGPIARLNLLENLENQIETAISQGEELLIGGSRVAELQGNYLQPTVFQSINKESVLRTQELFGPVATLIKVENIEEAVEVANENTFGLGASIWTKNTLQAERIAKKIEAGAVHINSIVKSEPSVPFGGSKKSGLGKELGKEGIREFTLLKIINVDEG